MNETYGTKTVIITGASRGLGAETAKYFAKHNYNTILIYRTNDEKTEILKNELESKYQIKAISYQCDVGNESNVKELLNYLIDNNIKIDTLINNAAINSDSLVEDKTTEQFTNVLNTNLIGTFLMCKYIGNYMKNNNGTSIVNISSTNAIDSYYPFSMEYDASKSGVISLTHNFAIHYAPTIRVNCVAPGWINTESNNLDATQIQEECNKILLNRFAEPEEIAQTIYFAATNSYLNDSIIKIDGGHR